MFGMYNTSVQVEANYSEPACENSEEYGQKYGSVFILPSWPDRIRLQTGQLLITLGQKITATSTKKIELSKEMP